MKKELLDPDLKIKLLESANVEERFFIENIQKTFAFYASLNSAIFAATIAGAMRAEEAFHLILVLAGPILIVACAEIGKIATSRHYQRFLEVVTTKAKLESDIGLFESRMHLDVSTTLWPKEGIVAQRHIQSRKKYKSSIDFVSGEKKNGLMKSVYLTFLVFQIISIIFKLILIFYIMRYYY